MKESNQEAGKRWRELSSWKKFLESPSTYWAILKMDLQAKRVQLGLYIGNLVAGEDIINNY